MEGVFSPEAILSSTRAKYSKALEECKPLFALFEVTNTCDLNCKHPMLDCKYCGLPSELGEDELTTDEIHSLIHNIYNGGTTAISLIGGEPTLRPDLLQIVSYASLRMEVTLVTNGQLLDREYVRGLKDAGISWIKVYLDSPDAEIHDSIRGEGTHRKAYQAIQNCRQADVRVSVINAVTPLNYKQLRDMIRLAIESRAVVEMAELLPSQDSQLVLTKEQRREAQRVMLEGQGIFGRDKVRFGSYYIVSEDEEGLKIWADPSKKGSNVGYPWGIYGYGIKANGIMVPDPLITVPLGDLRTQKLDDIWNNSVMINTLRHRGRLKGKCGKCEYRFVCGGHRGRAYFANNDFLDEDPACWYEPRLT